MRYSKSEATNILGIFNTGDVVTISIYQLSDNTKIIDNDSCSEIGTTGVFKYDFFPTVTQKEEFLWIMTNGEYSKYGKIVLGGYVDTNQHSNSVELKKSYFSNTVQLSSVAIKKWEFDLAGNIPILDATYGINVGDIIIDISQNPPKQWICLKNNINDTFYVDRFTGLTGKSYTNIKDLNEINNISNLSGTYIRVYEDGKKYEEKISLDKLNLGGNLKLEDVRRNIYIYK